MDTLEFAKRLIMILDDSEIREILKKAAIQGFSVQGFKSPWKAPRSTIIKCMERKRRGGNYYYIIILEVIASLDSTENTSEISAPLLAKNWIDNKEIMYEKIEYGLSIIEKNYKTNKKEDEQILVVDSTETNGIFEREHDLLEKNEVLQGKNKKLQLTIQEIKIELSNLKKAISQLNKINEKLDKEVTARKKECEGYINENYLLNEKINDKENYLAKLAKQIDELKKYKECAPKIACFIKTKVGENELGGYDITYIHEWNGIQENNLIGSDYDEIWIVHKGFSYSDITEIKTCFNCNTKEFLSIANLKNKMGGSK